MSAVHCFAVRKRHKIRSRALAFSPYEIYFLIPRQSLGILTEALPRR